MDMHQFSKTVHSWLNSWLESRSVALLLLHCCSSCNLSDCLDWLSGLRWSMETRGLRAKGLERAWNRRVRLGSSLSHPTDVWGSCALRVLALFFSRTLLSRVLSEKRLYYSLELSRDLSTQKMALWYKGTLAGDDLLACVQTSPISFASRSFSAWSKENRRRLHAG